MALIGLDIGGTKMLVAAADHTGVILRSTQAPTPLNREEGLALVKKMINEVAQGDSIEAIGASCGGPLNPFTGTVSPLHQPEWREVPLREVFEREFQVPLRFDVDTDAAALAEYRFGSIQSNRFLYLTLSTGMGGGLLVDGAIYRGHNGVHPEAGHQTIPYRLRNYSEPIICPCGATGCLEALVSGNGIRRIYKKKAEELGSEEWEEVGYNLGQGLRNLAILYAPDVVVMGGGIATKSGDRFLPIAEQVMRDGLRLVPPPALVVSSLGYNTALLGAVALAQSLLETSSGSN